VNSTRSIGAGARRAGRGYGPRRSGAPAGRARTPWRAFFAAALYDAETAYCLRHRDPLPFLAARFAAKEAASKAFGTGIARGFGWKTFSVVHDEHGAPVAVLDDSGRALLAARGATGLLVSSATPPPSPAVVLLVK